MEGDNDIMRFTKNQKWCGTEHSRRNEKILHLQEGKHIVGAGGKQQKIEVAVLDGLYISVIWEA